MAASDAERMMALFAGNSTAYGTHGEPTSNGLKWEIKTSARTVRGLVTVGLWERHLSGGQPLGVIPIRDDDTVSWGSIDIDVYDRNLLDVLERAEQLKLPLVPCRSKSGGLHMFLFMLSPVAAGAMRALLIAWSAALGHANADIYPRQAETKSAQGGIGNWIVAPYFGGTYGDRVQEQAGVKKTGALMTLGEFLAVAEAARVAPTDLDKIRVRAPEPRRANGAEPDERGRRGPFSDGPPCLEHLAAVRLPENSGRNKVLLMMGIYYKKAHPGSWKEHVENANRDYCDPPLTAEEVMGVIQSLSKKDYAYTCKEDPMRGHCDSRACRFRRHGVGIAGSQPRITGLSKLDTDPPIWFVDIDESRIDVSTQELMLYQRFQQRCADKLSLFYLNVKQAEWVQALAEAAQNLMLVEAPTEVGTPGRFVEALEDFLTDRPTAHRREELLNGLPWKCEEDNRFYFRLKDLDRFLVQQGWRDMTRGKMTELVKTAAGGGHRQLRIGETTASVWWVPGACVQARPRPEAPPVPRDPI